MIWVDTPRGVRITQLFPMLQPYATSPYLNSILAFGRATQGLRWWARRGQRSCTRNRYV